MNTKRSILTLVVGVALAFASTAQADHWAQHATSKTYAVKHSTWLAQNAARLRAQGMLSAFRRAHGPGGIAPGGLYTRGLTILVPSVVICPEQAPGDSSGYCTLVPSESPAATPTTDESVTNVTNND